MRRYLPNLFFSLAALGATALIVFPLFAGHPDAEDLMKSAKDRVRASVHELVPSRARTIRTFQTDHFYDAIGFGLQSELLVGPDERFLGRIELSAGQVALIGFDGEELWAWDPGVEEFRSLDRSLLDSDETLPDPRMIMGLSPGVEEAASAADSLAPWWTRHLLRQWGRLSEALEADDGRFVLEDRVHRDATRNELWSRFATQDGRGDQRLRLWLDEVGAVQRIDFGVLRFRVEERLELGLEIFEAAHWRLRQDKLGFGDDSSDDLGHGSQK